MRRLLLPTLLLVALILPALELVLPQAAQISSQLRTIFIFCILALGLNVLTGYTGLLNLGVAAFMAIGTYTYSILTAPIYPFQLSFWGGVAAAIFAGGLVGVVLGLPTLRLRGDYLAIVTLGFGELMQDALRNLDVITKGTQTITPVAPPRFPFLALFDSQSPLTGYYVFLALLTITAILVRNIEHSRTGRLLIAIREDELATRCMGINILKLKLLAFAIAACICSLAGALWASQLQSSSEPGNFDFQVSILAVCAVIVGGLGSIDGAIVGALLMVGFNSIVLTKLADILAAAGIVSTQNVYSSPLNWKYFVFGFALILMMRFRPAGLLPAERQLSE